MTWPIPLSSHAPRLDLEFHLIQHEVKSEFFLPLAAYAILSNAVFVRRSGDSRERYAFFEVLLDYLQQSVTSLPNIREAGMNRARLSVRQKRQIERSLFTIYIYILDQYTELDEGIKE